MRIIALDIGNVCLEIRLNECLKNLEMNTSQNIPNYFWNATDDMERGKLREDEWLDVFIQTTDDRFEVERLKRAYNSIIGPEIRETREFAKLAAANGCRLVFFSDTSGIHLDHILANLSFAHLITGGVYSFEVGAKKPERAMYAEFERRYGAPSLYLDDKPENIKAGLDAGWTSLQFKAGDMTAENLLESISQ